MLKIVKTAVDGTAARFDLEGAVDDVADFAVVVATPETSVVLDFDKVSSVNSYGIKKLMQLVNDLKGKSKVIRLQRCHTQMIETINMIPSLTQGVTVDSFYLPMECEPCNLEEEKLVTAAEAKASGFTDTLNERFPCDKCARHLTFLDDETFYFRFLTEG
jgi:hypothetical protein